MDTVIPESKSITETISPSRRLILLSGYYGFGNLGDEAILEVLINDLLKLVDVSDIAVLSNQPSSTREVFGVNCYSRWNLRLVLELFQRTRLFVSGGGGLFQDTSSVKSVAYYSALHHLAYLTGVDSLVYAQGLGPLNSPMSVFLTKRAFKLTDHITVRDPHSLSLLNEMDVKGELTSDPVWCLESKVIPNSIEEAIANEKDSKSSLLVGLSLRTASNFYRQDLENLSKALIASLPSDACLVPLVLQKEKDKESLDRVCDQWKDLGRRVLEIDFSKLERPSHCLDLISRLDFVVGMRLHSLIMALSSAVPTLGLSYDPKVEAVMKEFGQPFLNLINENPAGKSESHMTNLLNGALARRQENIATIKGHRKRVRQLACKNFQLLDRILSQ